MIARPKLVLASGSPRRLALLAQIGLAPDSVFTAEMDETPKRSELPRALAQRLAGEKAENVIERVRGTEAVRDAYILAADTVVAVGRRILPKPDREEEAAACLRLLSGRTHRVYTGVCLVTPRNALKTRLVESRVRFKRLSSLETDSYLASGEWRGKAGGYAIQGIAGSFVVKLSGSYPNVVGMPLYETASLLAGNGFPVHSNWAGLDT
ncbi:MAG: Maf-like protein [Rhizobiales bacterium]|nr:Maf-like protein [Hyphomicrobiales bacterium]